jgi:hypothetical protein
MAELDAALSCFLQQMVANTYYIGPWTVLHFHIIKHQGKHIHTQDSWQLYKHDSYLQMDNLSIEVTTIQAAQRFVHAGHTK